MDFFQLVSFFSLSKPLNREGGMLKTVNKKSDDTKNTRTTLRPCMLVGVDAMHVLVPESRHYAVASEA